ncbi:MAG: aminopeptidase [Acetobacteraceae bacterium]|nr:aminopeptidase [Acetobacteraceae bacterium]
MEKLQVEKLCRTIVEKCAGIRPGEVALVVSSLTQSLQIAKELFRSLTARGSRAALIFLPEVLLTDDRLPPPIAQATKGADALLLYTQRPFPPQAHAQALKGGARSVTMCGLTEQTLWRTALVDYDRLAETTREVAARLEKARKVRIKTPAGTDLSLTLAAAPPFACLGTARKRGEDAFVPSGMVARAVEPGSATGTVVVDGSLENVGVLTAPVTLTVRAGKVSRAEGGEPAQALEHLLNRGDEWARGLAEIAVGTNPHAQISGLMPEDTRVLGTASLGLGRNSHLGGPISSNSYVRAVLRQAEVWLGSERLEVAGMR